MQACLHSGSLMSQLDNRRRALVPAMTQPSLVDGLGRIVRELGGLTRSSRFGQVSMVSYPPAESHRFSTGTAKHYGVSVAFCLNRETRRENHGGTEMVANPCR